MKVELTKEDAEIIQIIAEECAVVMTINLNKMKTPLEQGRREFMEDYLIRVKTIASIMGNAILLNPEPAQP